MTPAIFLRLWIPKLSRKRVVFEEVMRHSLPAEMEWLLIPALPFCAKTNALFHTTSGEWKGPRGTEPFWEGDCAPRVGSIEDNFHVSFIE
jgi:hypothetical protein